ncbi:MAG: DNA polymerase III subunit gamma/tau [Aquabacterium sp.]|nr:MAG: DNA polymerase III subunit gamma/tau [Aquabacterium sp.]
MSYLVLARKYRPRSFEQMVGQPHVVQALSNALKQRRLHHAYLFTGTRGVGKTTVSRVLAKSLNCMGPQGDGDITAHPCGVCQACRDIDAGRFVDYVELDAASNRGVEEISQLLEQAVYKPVVGRFKVYMIDEVHMLSNTAFNAMLKTLEEPPEYLKFVLATTDPQKVPVTVLSRCLQFNLRPMAAQTIEEHLAHVSAEERIEAEPGALRLIARAARGSMRDALSLTDQAVAFGAGRLVESVVRTMLGAVDAAHVMLMLRALARADAAALVDAVDALRVEGISASATLETLADRVQRLAVQQMAPRAQTQEGDDDAGMQELAQAFSSESLQLIYSVALHGRGELGLAPDEYGALTMVVLRMLAFMPGSGEAPQVRAPDGGSREADAAQQRPMRTASPEPAAATAQPPAPSRALQAPGADRTRAVLPPQEPAEPDMPEPPADYGEADAARRGGPGQAAPAAASAGFPITELGTRWFELVQRLIAEGAINALVRELAWQAQCIAADEAGDTLRWKLRVEQQSLRSDTNRDRLQAAITQVLGRPAHIEIEAGAPEDTPARREAARRERLQRAADELIQGDPVVLAMREQFKTARIVPGSVRPI